MEGEILMLLQSMAIWVQWDKDIPELILSLALIQTWGCPACSPQSGCEIRELQNGGTISSRSGCSDVPLHFLREVLLRSLPAASCWYLTQFPTQNRAVVALPRGDAITILMEGLCKHIFYDNGMWNTELHWPGWKKKKKAAENGMKESNAPLS